MLHYSDDIDCGTRHDRQKPENDIHHKRHGEIIEVVLFVFCSLPFHVPPFMPDRFIDGIIAKRKIDRQCVEGFVEQAAKFPYKRNNFGSGIRPPPAHEHSSQNNGRNRRAPQQRNISKSQPLEAHGGCLLAKAGVNPVDSK